MQFWIVDASVAAKWLMPEPNHEAAKAFLQKEEYFLVPKYFYIEMESLLSKKVRRNILTAKEAKVAMSTLEKLPLLDIKWSRLRVNAFHIATHFAVSYYDAIYLALALTVQSPLITADKRLVSASKSIKPRPDVRFLLDYS